VPVRPVISSVASQSPERRSSQIPNGVSGSEPAPTRHEAAASPTDSQALIRYLQIADQTRTRESVSEMTLVPPTPESHGAWHNWTHWTAQHLRYSVNVTKFAPSLEDLILAGPRMVKRLGSFISFPDTIDGFGQPIGADATQSRMFDGASGMAMDSTGTAHSSSTAMPFGLDADPTVAASKFSVEGTKGLGSVFSYATSKWALCCIAMAVILNRAHIFATTRRRLVLPWHARLLIRILPLVLFGLQARRLLQSMQCQTSAEFAEMRWGDSSKSSDLMFSQNSHFLHGLSSLLLLRPSDRDACLAVNMIPDKPPSSSHELRGSLSLLWPLFGTFCLSQFLETISCAVQGRPLAAETGMTLFEHSLAFAEADAAISNQLGWGIFSGASESPASSTAGSTIAISRSMILRRVNTSPEVLLVALLSTFSHITSHLLALFNLQAKFRLFSTGFWGLCFMGSILWSALAFSLENPASQGLLRFPTVCIIGFVPHVLVLVGIAMCFSIYVFALLLSALAPPSGQAEDMGFRQRLMLAQRNMQANISLSDIRISREMDFYTALLRTGFGAITLASEAVYLNEDRSVNLKHHTWLEEERFQELEELRMQWQRSSGPGSRHDFNIGTIGLIPVQSTGQGSATSGFARERAAQKIPKARSGADRRLGDAVGASERSGRWLMALDFVININRILLKAWALMVLKLMAALGLRWQPRTLLWLIRSPKPATDEKRLGQRDNGHQANHSAHGTIAGVRIPRGDQVDVETEVRQRIQADSRWPGGFNEEELDARLYNWWLRGGAWGLVDRSGDYMPNAGHDDFDTTSVISQTTNDEDETGWVSDWGSDADEEDRHGQRTPTQRSPQFSREGSPLVDMPMHTSELARLLHPRSPEEQEEARALSTHLASDGIMTRSRYRQVRQLQRSEVLGSRGTGAIIADRRSIARAGKLGPEEEAMLLEQILLSRRTQAQTPSEDQTGSSSWATGGAGMGHEGPQCVVCQSMPRTVIVWPCRCLSLCDDCRVSLAMNNFDKCVCCRREVSSFSRIYVP